MANTTNRRVISLNRETFIYLFNIVNENLKKIKSDADLSDYCEEELKTRTWRVEQAERASKELGIAQILYDAVLFGTDEV